MVPDSMSALLMRKLPYQGDFFCCFLQIFTFSTHGRAGRIRRIDSKDSPRKALKAQCSKTSFSHKFTSVLKTDTIIYGFGSYHFRSCKIFSWKNITACVCGELHIMKQFYIYSLLWSSYLSFMVGGGGGGEYDGDERTCQKHKPEPMDFNPGQFFFIWWW